MTYYTFFFCFEQTVLKLTGRYMHTYSHMQIIGVYLNKFSKTNTPFQPDFIYTDKILSYPRNFTYSSVTTLSPKKVTVELLTPRKWKVRILSRVWTFVILGLQSKKFSKSCIFQVRISWAGCYFPEGLPILDRT